MAIGFDKGKTNLLKLTFQIAVPKGIGGGGGGEGDGGGGGGDQSSFVLTIESPSLYSAINMANTTVSRQLNLSHAKVVIFSRELAEAGIDKYIHAMMRGREFRPNMSVLVARTSAENFIRDVQPKLEANPAKYYELILNSYNYTSFIANTQMINFYNHATGLYENPVAILADINTFKSSEDMNLKGSTNREKGENVVEEGDFKAGGITKYADLKAEYMGLGVFDGSKMVGELDGEETGYYLMATGEYHYAYWTLPDPKVKGSYVILNIKQSRSPKRSVQMVNGKPVINLKVRLEGDILNIQSGTNYEDPKQLPELEKYAENFLKEGMLKMLHKTSGQYHSDICGFGAEMKRKFLTLKEWEDFYWLSRYKDSSFNVEVDFKVRRPGLIIRTVPFNSSTEKVEVEKQ